MGGGLFGNISSAKIIILAFKDAAGGVGAPEGIFELFENAAHQCNALFSVQKLPARRDTLLVNAQLMHKRRKKGPGTQEQHARCDAILAQFVQLEFSAVFPGSDRRREFGNIYMPEFLRRQDVPYFQYNAESHEQLEAVLADVPVFRRLHEERAQLG